jgi:FkbM family methyltransferase
MLINNIDYKIIGDESDKYYQHFLTAGSYGDDVTSYLTSVIKNDWVCFDVGANIGLTTIFMSSSALNVSVVAFEPSPKNIPYLMNNINQNRLSTVTVVPVGLGDEPGFAEFVDIPGFSAGSHVKSISNHPDAADVRTISIKIDSLDFYVSRTPLHRLDLLKIDAEGFELNVLRGALNTLKQFKPLVIIEFNSWFMKSVQQVEPLSVLENLFDTFSDLQVISGASATSITNNNPGKMAFIKENLERGGVDNLVGTM